MVRVRNLKLVKSAAPPSNNFLDMASRILTLPMTLFMLEIPFPEEDDMSDDEFDG